MGRVSLAEYNRMFEDIVMGFTNGSLTHDQASAAIAALPGVDHSQRSYTKLELLQHAQVVPVVETPVSEDILEAWERWRQRMEVGEILHTEFIIRCMQKALPSFTDIIREDMELKK